MLGQSKLKPIQLSDWLNGNQQTIRKIGFCKQREKRITPQKLRQRLRFLRQEINLQGKGRDRKGARDFG